MSARRLLLVCYFYPPLAGGGVHRVLSFTRHLPAHGWDCTVVCAGPEDYWVTDDSLTAGIPAGTEVIRVRGGSALSAWLRLRPASRGRRSGGTFGRLRRLSDWWLLPDSYAGWARRARAAAARRLARGGVDAVLTSSPPDSVQLVGLGLRREFRGPWVADFRDPWVGLHFREPPTAWHRARQARWERAVLERSDLVLAASRTDAARLEADPAIAPRVLHLPNGFEPGERPPGSAPDPDHFRLAFTGTMSQMPDTGVFLEALHELLGRRPEARRRVRAALVGPYDQDDENRAEALGLTGIVEFTGPRPHEETRALQRAADVLLLWKPRGLPTMVPGKLYEYLDAGRPIVGLLGPEDEAGEMVARAGGTLSPPGDVVALAAAIEARYEAWRSGGRAPSVRPEWVAGHARARLAARLAGALDRAVEARA